MSVQTRAAAWSLPSMDAQPDSAPVAVVESVRRFRAMATDVTLRVVEPTAFADDALDRAEDVFRRVESSCTRFDPDSPLMRANASPTQWHGVPAECLRAVAEAARAHLETDGAFDPRVLETLVASGYDRTRDFEDHEVRLGTHAPRPPAPSDSGPWLPGIDESTSSIRIGARPIDLGGIGKGLAVRWAQGELAGSGRSVLVEAGGDCSFSGAGPRDVGWSVGIEDPRGGDRPIAVLGLADRACATSSLRIRRWWVDGVPTHHLIDPRTGLPGGDGLLSVTVVDGDPARAEVWSKSLFLAGADGIAAESDRRGIAAVWVTTTGATGRSEAIAPYLTLESA